MSRPSGVLTLAVSAVLSVVLFACGGSPPTASTPASSPATCSSRTIKIGVPVSPPNVVHLPAYMANDLGYFKQENLDVQFLTFQSGVESFRAMASGSVDVAGSALESITGAVAQGAETKVVSSYQVPNDFAFVVGPSIQKLSDLKGKRVNIESAGSIADALSRFVLQKAKVDPSQVQFVTSTTAGRVTTLLAGQADTGVLHYDQALNVMQRDPQLHILVNLATALPNYQTAGWAMSTSLLQSDPATAECMIRALIKGNRAMYDSTKRQQVLQIAVKYTKEPEPVVSDTLTALAKSKVWPQNEGVSRSAVLGTLKSMQQRNLLPSNPGYAKLVDLTIATKVVKQLGRKTFPY
jgi:NitT/TauT family transport system substrate-binding protein